jgi:hypothetical protein
MLIQDDPRAECRPAFFAAYRQFLRETGTHLPPGIALTALSAEETLRFMAAVIGERAAAGEGTAEGDLAAIGFTPAEIARHKGPALKRALAAFEERVRDLAADLAAA